jgi:hypothetical protein
VLEQVHPRQLELLVFPEYLCKIKILIAQAAVKKPPSGGFLFHEMTFMLIS